MLQDDNPSTSAAPALMNCCTGFRLHTCSMQQAQLAQPMHVPKPPVWFVVAGITALGLLATAVGQL
jgi:hypothetical protein